jgi:hypothetical protein
MIEYIINNNFSPDLIERFVTWITEKGHVVWEGIKNAGSKFMAWLNNEDTHKPVEKRRFNKTAFQEEIDVKLSVITDGAFLKSYLIMDPKAYSPISFKEFMGALTEAYAKQSQTIPGAIGDTFSIIGKQRDELKKTVSGPIITALDNVANECLETFNNWQSSVQSTLNQLHKNLEAQKVGTPLPLSETTLDEFSSFLTYADGFLPSDADLKQRFNQAYNTIQVRRNHKLKQAATD